MAQTQRDLAVSADVSDDAISRAERGQAISLANASAIAAFFNVELAELTAPKSAPPASANALTSVISNIPIRVPEHFLGRDAALGQIEAALATHRGRVAITTLHGLRGVGKTVLAAAYAELHAAAYRATWWIGAETEATMRGDLAGLAVRLGCAAADAPEDQAVVAVLARLAQDGDGILLIYDNALGADEIVPFLPRGGTARVLITSNAHVWRRLATPIRLDVWPEEIGAEFLIARTGRSGERDDALSLSELLGGLPLAHEQAAAYCERLDLPLAEYIRRFEAEPARLLDTEYHDRTTVAKSFTLAIEAAEAPPHGHPAAGLLILLCSLLAPEPIPLYLFRETLGQKGGPFEGDGLDEAVAALRAFALIERETIADERDPAMTTETIRLHRLVREIAALRCRDEDRDAAISGLTVAMTSVYPADAYNNPSGWPRARRLDALALGLVIENGAMRPHTAPRARLANQLAMYRLGALGTFGPAEVLLRSALRGREAELGPEHPDTLLSVNNLAGCLEHLGDAAAARPLYERALDGHERMPGPEHPSTLTSVNNLAACLQRLGDAAAARPLLERALAARERVLGPEHPDTLGSVNNLAYCLQRLGDAAAARPLLERALDGCERVLGPEHPDTLLSVNNLAGCLERLGDAAAARPLLERALAARERVLGPEHPDTLLSVNNLAGCLERLGDAAAARPLLERALDGCERVLGPEHPTTIIVRDNLAALTQPAA